MSNNDDELTFADAFDVSAWSDAKSGEDANAGGEFMESGARALKITRITVRLNPAVTGDEKISQTVLASALKDLMLAHARAASDLFKTSEYDKQMIKIAEDYSEGVAGYTQKFVGTAAHDAFVKALPKAVKFLHGKDPKKIQSAFLPYSGETAFSTQVSKVFPRGRAAKLLGRGDKETNIDSELFPLVETIKDIGKGSVKSVLLYLDMIVGLGWLMSGDANSAYKWFDDGISAAVE